MLKYLKVLVGLFFAIFVLNSYAIQINVQTSSKEVSALGFTVNGKDYGWLGTSYSVNNMPPGKYDFGVYVNGSDIDCLVGDQSWTTLSRDTTAILYLHGNKCIARIYSISN